jgi:inner membrane protein
MPFFEEIPGHMNYWHWGSVALLLLSLEMILPGFYFLWFGIASAVVAVILIFIPELGPIAQWISFAIAAIVLIGVSRAWTRRHPIGTDQPMLNRRGMQYVGQVFTLDTPIHDGRGRLKITDTEWPISGENLPAGTVVKVVGTDGIGLRVETYRKTY